MENPHRLYIVSFGDSNKYRYEFADVMSEDPVKKVNPLDWLEKDLHDFLEEKFPGRTFAYLVTPRVTEVLWKNREKYIGFPELNRIAVEQIKSVLIEEVESREDLKRLNNNAPYDQLISANN
ncbi:MAG: hypothetical protein NC201_03190 [Prevotella sp.]|nr:hypothetical protein [Bacteroides sp.]MCM1366232.1 hypothetical protein [Prevotella sp.]MCM1436363.1 hypothetical protein [Prevotella sp.]